MSEVALSSPDTDLLTTAEQRSLGLRLTVSLITGGCLIVAGAIELISPAQRDVAELVAGAAAALVAGPTLMAGWRSLRKPDLHGIMDQLIAIAVLAAWASGDLLTAALLPLVMTVGHILEERSLLGSQEAVRALSRLTRTLARKLSPSGAVTEVAAQALQPNDIIEVRAGDVIPADGIVLEGESSIDTASITGESTPLEVAPGAEVYNGSINADGLLVVQITKVGEQTTLGRVVALLKEAESAKPPVTRLLERYSQSYIILVLLLAAGSWFATGQSAVMLTMLVAACPCALVLATPATSIAAISVASRHGVLVKGAAFLETLATVDSVALDKTGTLTTGQLRLANALPEPGVSQEALINLAAELGAVSSHPVSRALARAPGEHEADRLVLTEVRETHGLGVVARDGEHIVALGRAALFESLGVKASPAPPHDGPVAGVSRGARFMGWVLLADAPRPEAPAALDALARLGLERQMLITGDRWPAARKVAELLHIPTVHAELLPAQKMETILAEIEAGRRPLVVGDGINDALALKAGAVGIAMGAQGTDVALASADLVLMSNDLRRLATCVRLSRRCRSTIYANFAISLIWTVVIVAAAGGGLLGAHGAIVAAVLQDLSVLLVVVNAGRMLKFQEVLAPIAPAADHA
ncbi:MAG TPA: cation-translocating P-type ATPase [Caulobacteraceae bacterium]|nr:cation-translocating P-type ATPase [Caulobacteraceae bacterium]